MSARAAIFAALVLAGCQSLQSRGLAGPAQDLRRREPGALLVGTARVDVTPPPGPSTFGHGPDARVSDGYWTRLQCRVFVLETRPEDRVALVCCDLHTISAILQREVAERVRDVVPTSRLLIAATHTHAGPAHYHESMAYGGITSARRPGFDPAMLEFLAGRIADGVVRASAARRPAAIRWVHTTAWKLTRNRSLDAHDANGLPLVADPPEGLTDEERAIDPALHVLQIQAADGGRGPIGWMVFFAMHPTVVAPSQRLFTADVFGVASRVLEAELRRDWAARCGEACAAEVDPLAAILNTNWADMSPIWSSGTVEEAIRVGGALAERAWETQRSDAPLRASIVVDSRYLESELPGAPFGHGKRLCETAELGAASSRGASDHPVAIDALLGGAPAADGEREHCQAPKRRLLGSLQTLLVGSAPTSFPTHAPMALLRIDDTFLSLVPAEFSIQAGAALNARVLAVVGSGAHALVVGPVNAYLLYVVTRREYQAQRYEGASTLYGPDSAEYFAERATLLARSIMGEPIDADLAPGSPRVGEAVAFAYEVGPLRDRLPRADGSPLALQEPRRQRGLCRVHVSEPPAICFWWSDLSPGQVPLTSARWLSLIDAQTGLAVRVCNSRRPLGPAVCDPAASIDDRGLDFQTRVRGRRNDAWLWSTLLRPSPAEWDELRKRAGVRLRAEAAAGLPAVESKVFSAAAMPQSCSDEAVRFCLGDREPEPR